MNCQCEWDFYHFGACERPATVEHEGAHYCEECFEELVFRTLIHIEHKEAVRSLKASR